MRSMGIGIGISLRGRLMAGAAVPAGAALSAPELTRTSAVTAYPPTVEFSRPIDWADVPTMYGVMQRSQDPTFAAGVTEKTLQILAATTTYDFDLDTIASGVWYFRLGAYRGTRPGSLNWSNIQGVGDAVAPTITSTAAPTGYQFAAGSLALTADKAATWEIVGGFDMAQFSISGSTLSWLAQPTTTDIVVQVQATSYFGVPSAIQTITLDVVPNTANAFTFTDETAIARSTVKTSNTITVAGIGAPPITVSITGGTYSKNGGAYTSSAGTATNGDTFAVRQTSSADYSTATNTTLTIGTTSDTYTVTTEADPLAVPELQPIFNPAHYSGAPTSSVTFAAQPLGAAAANRLIVVGITHDNTDATPSSVTIGGVTATLVRDGFVAWIYAAIVPTGTTGDVVVNGASLSKMAVQGFRGIGLSATPASTGEVAFNYSDPTSVTPTIPTNGHAVAFLTGDGGAGALTITVSAGTSGYQTQMGADYPRTMRSAYRSTAGNLTFTGHGGGGNNLVYAVFAP